MEESRSRGVVTGGAAREARKGWSSWDNNDDERRGGRRARRQLRSRADGKAPARASREHATTVWISEHH
eukprot:3988216-Pyramimonas_sp.AAC.1